MALADGSNPLMLELVQIPKANADPNPLVSGASDPIRFHLMVSYSCPQNSAQNRLFVSVADASLSARLTTSPQELILTVPAPQLAGLLQTSSCPAGVELTKRQVLAYATLSCEQESGTRHHNVSQPLAVSVVCTETDKPGPVAEEQTDPL